MSEVCSCGHCVSARMRPLGWEDSYPPKGASMGFGLVIGYASDTDDWGVYVLSPHGYPIAEIGPRGTKREAQQWIDQAARNGERITPTP